jgi:hypothetical protein
MTTRHADALCVLLICTVLAEMVLPVPGKYSMLLLLMFCAVSFLASRGFRFQRRAWLFMLPAALYGLTALTTGLEYNVVRVDLVNIAFGIAFVLFAGIPRMEGDRRARLFRWLHRGVVVVGIAAAYGGILKLLVLNRGIVLPWFSDADGLPFPGSSLNGDYNVYSVGLVFSLVSAVWLARNETATWSRYAAQLAVPGIVAAAMLTSSRRTVLFLLTGAVVAAAWWALGRRRRARNAPPLKRWVIAGAYAAAVVLLIPHGAELRRTFDEFMASPAVLVVTTRYESIGTSGMVESRMDKFEQGIERIARADAPALLFGTGFGYVGEMGGVAGIAEDYPHNLLLSAMVYGGVLQTGLMLLMLVAAFRSAWRAGGDGRVMCTWLAFMVAFLFASSNSVFSMKLLTLSVLMSLDAGPIVAGALEPVRDTHTAWPFTRVPTAAGQLHRIR